MKRLWLDAEEKRLGIVDITAIFKDDLVVEVAAELGFSNAHQAFFIVLHEEVGLVLVDHGVGLEVGIGEGEVKLAGERAPGLPDHRGQEIGFA